jgi:rod shape-determining protein MreC
LDVALLAVSGFLALLAIVLPANIREAAAAALRRSVVAPLVALQRRAELSRTALISHEEVTTRQDSLALRALSVGSIEAENDRLRKLLGLGRRLQWGFIAAEALRGDASMDEYTLTLTAGSRAGVTRFSPVIAAEGLVGMVDAVDPTLSLAIVWSHPDFRVSAMTVDGSAFGIAAAHLGRGADRYLVELRGVPFRSELKPNTLVVSSGLGGVYPQGIPIGTVLRELETSEGWARTYLVRPAVLPSNVTSVMVLKAPRAAAGVQNVWASARAADSAARGIVAAADSIVRDSTRAAAARQAALDAARAAAAPRDTAPRPAAPATPAPAPVPRTAPADTAQRRPTPRPDSARRPATPPESVRAVVPIAAAPSPPAAAPRPDSGARNARNARKTATRSPR